MESGVGAGVGAGTAGAGGAIESLGALSSTRWRASIGFSGAKPTWRWSSWSPIASVFSAPSNVMRLMICAGFIVPRSVSSSRIVASVIEPAPWLPMIGTPLIAAMSTAVP